jgi:sporulation protein YlmC with PRC-barrel domain
VSASRVFVARLAGCSVFDPLGDRVGRVRDVLVVYRKDDPPRVVGLVVEIPGKRRVFLSIGRVTSVGSGQIITTGLINVRRFEQRGGEVRVIAEMLGRRVALSDGSGDATIEDVAIGRSASSSAAAPRPAADPSARDPRSSCAGRRSPSAASRARRSRRASCSPRTPT